MSPVGGLHYNGELHPIPTPQDGLAVSITFVVIGIKYDSNCDFSTLETRNKSFLLSQVKILDAMQDIYYGRVSSPWALDVDDWSIDPNQVKFMKIFDQT